MSAIDVQLRFAAEFALFLVSLAGIGFSFLRADLLVVRPAARLAGAVGFGALAAAALCSGALIVDDPSTAVVVGLRSAGIVLLAFASFSWNPDSRGRDLLRIGLLALVFAEVLLGRDESAVVDISRVIGALAIGACLVGASARVISARIAASGAMIVFAVITVVAVALSAIVSDNIEDEALRRYGSRVVAEASAVDLVPQEVLPTAKLIARVLSSGGSDDLPLDLRRVLGRSSATDEQLAESTAAVIDAVNSLAQEYGSDLRRGPTLISPNSGGTIVAYVPNQVVDFSEPAFVTDLSGLIEEARVSPDGAQDVVVAAGRSLAVAAYPIAIDRSTAGVLVRTSFLDETYLLERLPALSSEGDGVRLSIASREAVLAEAAADGDQGIDPQVATALATAAADRTGEPERLLEDRFVVAAPVDSKPTVAVVLSVPRVQEEETREDLFRVLFLVAMGAATAALLLAGAAGQRIGGGLRRLSEAAEAIQGGKLDVRTGVDTDDELGALGTAFDSMARSLQDRTAELRQAADDEAELRGRLEAVVGGMGEALVAVDADGEITDFNAAAEQLFEVRAREARGRRVHEVIRLRGEDGRDLSRRLVRPVTSTWVQPGTVVLADGSEIPVVVSAGTLRGPGNDVVGAVFVVRDERRERELDRMKTEFLANISHELRTPLTPIKGFASILQTRDLPSTKTKGFADEISSAADQLERVIGQLVNFATVVGGTVTLDPETMSVRSFLDDTVKRWRARTGSSHKLVRRVPNGVPRLVADRAYLAQALDELVDNAVKYSPEGGQIVVAAQVVETDGGPAMELSVTDPGLGIPLDRQSSILEDFAQGDASATRRFGGLGLGLALVQRIARAHGGDVTIESVPGDGSRVAVVLPLDGPGPGSTR